MAGLIRKGRFALATALLLLPGAGALAEPYLSVRTGNPCNACHVNGTGGGMRTAFGGAYALNVLSVRPLADQPLDPEFRIVNGLRLGGDARYSGRLFDPQEGRDSSEFQTDRATLYADLRLNDVVELYTDQQVAPGGAVNRESWVRLNRGPWYLKGGKFYLPYGWPLEDDTAYVRQATGINFATADNGVEGGYQDARLQARLAVTNGSGGGSENNNGKQMVLRANWIGGWGQVGLNAGYNDGSGASRKLLGITGGFNTGALSWLLEYDHLTDSANDSADQEQDLGLLEANWLIVRGHNLKFTVEWQNFDEGGDRRRGSAVWEWFPWSHTQLRTGLRTQESSDLPFSSDGEEYFVQAHIYF